jgi:hypothetical protein
MKQLEWVDGAYRVLFGDREAHVVSSASRTGSDDDKNYIAVIFTFPESPGLWSFRWSVPALINMGDISVEDAKETISAMCAMEGVDNE